jgi:hypothetical protein
MSLTLPADAGEPMTADLFADAEVRCHKFGAATRQVSIRNTGTNTLWFMLEDGTWIDLACGTSWDDRVNIKEFHYCTQIGRTRFVVVGLALQSKH